MTQPAMLTLEGVLAQAIRHIRTRVQEEVALQMGNPIAIAGHTFEDGPDGRQCTICKKRWVDVAGATSDALGSAGFLCNDKDKLAQPQLDEIAKVRDMAWDFGRGA